MQKSTDTKSVVKGIKELTLDFQTPETLQTPEDSRAADAVKVTIPGQAKTSKMSLPGLDLSAPVETVVTPTVHELKEQTEWRFEVAFGTRIEVRVNTRSFLSSCEILTKLRSSFQVLLRFSAPKSRSNRHTPLRALKRPSTPGMAVASRSSATAKSITSLKRPP